MNNDWLKRWNDRYGHTDYAYGKEPNVFFSETLKKIPKGSILCPAEGEGRNAVYAASLGWNTNAYDISKEGKIKALQLAKSNNVSIDYQVGELSQIQYTANQFDVIALIYAHFPAEIRSNTHKYLNTYLRQGGLIIFEAFSKDHLQYNSKNPNVGGPKDLANLFSIEEIKSDFNNYEFDYLEEVEVDLNEGKYHVGEGKVIRFIAKKTS
ncbi:class I SAM-dependent methyltransferase [Corallibacter sp.]|uniref:class I SAM-dependent methyltransferase n=1 Tax=Corallibacter sp. TaxID=2038084 RepID=UPI003AB4AB08